MAITLTFYGAAGTVTGSCFLLNTVDQSVLVDCGMFQGSKTEKQLNYDPFPFEAKDIDGVLLTHAHIDHSGLLPKLAKAGFKGPIYATPATADLCSVMLPDSAHIQEMEVRYLNRRNRQRGRPEVTPIYSTNHVKACLKQFRDVQYEVWTPITKGIRARFWNAGHLLGSASIEVEVSSASSNCVTPVRILFSGDLGPDYKLLHPDPEAPEGVDYVVCESTYGSRDRLDRSPARRRLRLADEVNAAAGRGGPLIIPSFAVARAQELLTDLVKLMDDGNIPNAPLFLDSPPLATRASEVFIQHAGELDLEDDLLRAFRSKILHFSESVEESKAINRLRGFFIVIAASGMCDAGRIRHHLKNHLWRRDATILMVGYQAEGTLGRLLLDGVNPVRIQGEETLVKAAICAIDDYSGHADGPELASWISERKPIRRTLFLVHGEGPERRGLAKRIANQVLKKDRIIEPAIDDLFELSGDRAQLAKRELRRRIEPQATAQLDWNNDLTKLILDINDIVEKAGDEKSRNVILRRLRRALEHKK